MRVAVTEVPKAVSLIRGDEVWVQVLANRQPPWEEIQEFLREHHGDLFARCNPNPLECFEAQFSEDENEQYEFEDWYILERVR